ncbi:MAG: hypothetical protein K5629_08265 [Eubacteriales bacterium]|nr:hypothetical protein [Eubacteriales bacterium]
MKTLNVLFLGNSHTFFNDLAQVFKDIAESRQDTKVNVDMNAYPGVTFGWHLGQAAQLRYDLMYKGFDYVVLQQAAHEPWPPKEETIADGKKLIELVRLAGAKPIVCQPWAEKRYPEHQELMYDIYADLAKEANVPLTADGFVFEDAFKNHKDIDLYFLDGEHCSPYGTYVRALSAYALIFGESPVGVPAVSRVSYTMSEDAVHAAALLEKADKKRDSEEAKELMGRIWRGFSYNRDKDSVKVHLDEKKAKILQELVWRYTEKDIDL